jgi:hypothetical protein
MNRWVAPVMKRATPKEYSVSSKSKYSCGIAVNVATHCNLTRLSITQL